MENFKSLGTFNVYNTSNNGLYTVAKIALPKSLTTGKSDLVALDDDGNIINLNHFSETGMTNIYTMDWEFPAGESTFQFGTYPNTIERRQSPTLTDWISGSFESFIIKTRVFFEGDEAYVELNELNTVLSRLKTITPDIMEFAVFHGPTQGFLSKQYLEGMHQKDHVGVQYSLNWSDRNNPLYNSQRISKVELVCKDEIVFNYMNQFGIAPATYNSFTDEWIVTIPINSNFREGQGIELRGYILALPTNYTNGETFGNSKNRINNLKSVKNGELVFGGIGQVRGCATNMLADKSDWFFGNMQNIDINPEYPQKITHGNDIFGYKAVGPANNPSQTGEQEDFGADAGQQATVHGDCSWITYIEGAMTDHMRPFNIHDNLGLPITKKNYPNWITWDMETFDILSTETLGKTRYQLRLPGTGMASYDNQHRSWNNAFTFYALTGDNLVRDAMEKAIQVDLAQAKNGSLAEREVGRMLTWFYKAWKLTVSPYYRSNLESLALRLYTQAANDWRGKFFSGMENKVKVLQVVRDIRSGIYDENGDAYYTWIPYQTAEMVKGLYSFYLMVGDHALKDTVEEMIADLVSTIANYGCIQQDGDFYPLTFCKYNVNDHNAPLSPNFASPGEGVPLSPTEYLMGSPSIKVGSYDFWPWVGPALSIGLQLKEGLLSPETVDLTKEILTGIYMQNSMQPYKVGKWLLTSPF